MRQIRNFVAALLAVLLTGVLAVPALAAFDSDSLNGIIMITTARRIRTER